MTSDTPSASASIGDNNTNVNIEINQSLGPSLETDLSSAIKDLEEDIEQYNLSEVYTQKLVQAEQILKKINLSKVLDIMDCRRKPHSHDQKIRALLSFLINAMIIDDHFEAPNIKTMKTVLKSQPSWLFQIPRGEAECLSLHLTKIIKLFGKIPDSEIKNGTIFLSKLKQEVACEDCVGKELDTDFIRGVLRDWSLGQTTVFGNHIIEDYFAQIDARSITAKCGNCISSVQETEKAKSLFEVNNEGI